ncbi:MAG: hypothetical protein IKX20_02805 [Paludibacteraceae bacterium]|nr:hypothetical protein [Paludibacteraceae bacterium]
MIFAAFIIGMFVGGFVGLGAMCLCVISGDESRREELMGRNPFSETNKEPDAKQ